MRTRRVGAAVTAAAAVLGAVVATAPAAQAAPVLPSGFVLVDSPSGQQPGTLTDFAYLPDGSVLTTGRLGSVQWAPQGGQPVQIGNIPVHTGGSLGLTGIAVAPDYATTRTIYTTQAVSTSPTAKVFRLSKWRLLGTNEPTGLADESILLEFPANADSKGLQDVAVDPGGSILWVAVGDNANVRPPEGATKDNVDKTALRALDPAHPTGKILRIYTNRRGVEDNPFYDQNAPDSWRSRTYLSGLRDPRITLDPRGGVIVTDTGWAARDEVNLAFPGQNLKWPCWEGTTRTPGYRDTPECTNVANTAPLVETNRTAASHTALGGIPYTGASYPPAYQGKHFVADTGTQTLSTLHYDTAGKVTQPSTAFATDIGSPVALATALNGDVVIADAATSTLRRVTYKPANKAPTARFESAINPATRTVSFNASASRDPDHESLTYAWVFGDGGSATGRVTEHTYSANDSVIATLTVTDAHGASVSTSETITPGDAKPELTLSTPSPGTVFSGGGTVSVGASASDPVDGPLTVHWTVDRVHCPRKRACEVTNVRTGQGPAITVDFPSLSDIQLLVTAAATNNRNVTTWQQYTASPRLTRLQVFGTHHSQIKVGAGEDADLLVTVGSNVLITAPATALTNATFTKWADNLSNGLIRDVHIPPAGLSLVAEYISPVQKRYTEDTAIRTMLGSPSGFELYEAGSQWQQYGNGRLYWTEQHGAKAVYGDIALRYVAMGGHGFFGAPTTDELFGTKVGGLYNHFAGGPLTEGPASIYFTRATGPKAMWGPVRAKYLALGAEGNTNFGYPVNDLTVTPDGIGRYNHFEMPASIYWSPGTGAFSVIGAIREKWGTLGWETFLGYPTTDEVATPGGVGRFNHFAGTSRTGVASVYWSPATGAHEVFGSIRDRWAQLGWEANLGFPSTGELSTPTRPGKYNHFRIDANNLTSIYYSPGNGTWEVRGAIRDRWAALGWENSYLGFPRSGEYAIPTGMRSDFVCGYITWERATAIVRDVRTC